MRTRSRHDARPVRAPPCPRRAACDRGTTHGPRLPQLSARASRPAQHAAIRANILQDIHKQYIFWQLLKALKYMHSADLLHRDIKPSNLLLNSDCLMKVADFGLARTLTEADVVDTECYLTDYVATRWYRAPEILLGSTRYSFGVDLWAAGCILGEMVLGKPMFPGSSTINQIEKLIEVIGMPSQRAIEATSKFAPTMMSTIDCSKLGQPLADDLAEGARAADVKKRLNARLEQAGVAPPAVGALDLVDQLLAFAPEKRISVGRALEHAYVAQFHDKEVEREARFKLHFTDLEIGDKDKSSTHEYRNHIYSMMAKKYKPAGRGGESSHRTQRDY